MKKYFTFLFALFAMIGMAGATGTYNFGPAQIVSQNPVQSGVITQTNQLPALYTNTATFPYPFPSSTLPITGYVYNYSTNAANEPLTNTWTTTNVTIVSVATNTTLAYQAFQSVARVQTGILGLGSFLSGSTTYTNTFATPYVATPVVQLTGSGAGAGTNYGVWASSVTTTGFIVTTGNTNQIIYWGAIGPTALPGINVPTQ